MDLVKEESLCQDRVRKKAALESVNIYFIQHYTIIEMVRDIHNLLDFEKT